MKISIFNTQYKFTFRLGFSLFCVCFFSIFCILGAWQLHRYTFKKNLLKTYEQRLSASPKAFNDLKTRDQEELQFQPVIVEGEYFNDLTLLVQNKHHHEKVGYEVLTPFHVKGQRKLLLIDRGWTEHIDATTHDSAKRQKVKGYIKLLNEYQFILGDNVSHLKPLILQRIDIAEISNALKENFFPYILRLDASESYGYERDWTIVTGLPQRHLAYAIQWFAMALVLLIAYFCFCCERIYVKS